MAEGLRAALEQLATVRDEVYEKTSKYLELRNLLTVMDTNEMHDMKTMINVGCEFYMQASIPSTDRVCVDIGLGVHVDYSRAEALRFIQEREAAYNALVEQYTQEMGRIQEALLSAELEEGQATADRA